MSKKELKLEDITLAMSGLRKAQAEAELKDRREFFAAAALTGLLACDDRYFKSHDAAARDAIDYADAIIRRIDNTTPVVIPEGLIGEG